MEYTLFKRDKAKAYLELSPVAIIEVST